MGTELTMQEILEQMANQLTGLKTKVVRLRMENDQKDAEIDDLKKRIDKRHPTMEGEEEEEKMSLMTTLKAFFEQKELKVQVPEPHDWEGDQKGLKTFKRECETWIADRRITRYQDVPKAIMMITGWMKGTVAQWYTINHKSREITGNQWVTREEFWEDLERRFGDSNPSFTTRTKLEKLKQGQKLVHTYNSMFNKYSGLTGYNEAALVNAYYGGLNDNILHSIFQKDQVPKDLGSAQKATVTIENLKYRLEQFTSGQRREALITQKKPALQVTKPAAATPIV